MREIVETGTDVAAIAIGDPSLLGSLRAARDMAETRTALSNAVASGALWRTDTGADGAFLVHVFVDEEPDTPIRRFLQDPITVDRFPVPSGRLLVGGEEEFVGIDRERERRAMGREIDITAGEYHFTAYRVEAPPGTLTTRFAEQATPIQRRAWSFGNALIPICVLISVAAIAVSVTIYLRTASAGFALSALTSPAIAWWFQARFRARPPYRAAESLFRRIERELPSVVVVLHRHR
jgi:hypothetical protein